MQTNYSYKDSLAASERIGWRVQDIIGPDKALDFSRPFMPEPLAQVKTIGGLDAAERLAFNQIRGHTYLCIFGLVEEFILPFVLDHARPDLDADDYRTRALLAFAGEEAKHIHLFKCFREAFEAGFGSRCEVIGPARDVAEAVLAHDPLGVALAILHIEWMTQIHYVESVRDDGTLDPQFKSLLRHHWMEEAQHAKLDTLMVAALADQRSSEEIARGVKDYLEIGGFLDAGLAQQVELEIESFERASARRLDASARADIRDVLQRSMRHTFLVTGMRHPKFVETLHALGPEYAHKVAQAATALAT